MLKIEYCQNGILSCDICGEKEVTKNIECWTYFEHLECLGWKTDAKGIELKKREKMQDEHFHIYHFCPSCAKTIIKLLRSRRAGEK